MSIEAALGIHDAIEHLATINAHPEQGGITREVYTPEYAEAVAFTAAQMAAHGLDTRLDGAGNLIGRLTGTRPDLPLVLTGSHIDTTLNAGRYDGVVGVLGAIEAAGRLGRAPVRARRCIEVVAWAGEEPRFGRGCLGSRIMAGRLDPGELETLVDRDGVSAATAMRDAGLDPATALTAAVDLDHIHTVVELHVEQGGVLESAAVPIGVVTQIAAAHDLDVRIGGRAVHAGATPMALRQDALLGAAEIALAVERIAQESPSGTTVGTVGVLGVLPGAINVVPGEARMLVDVRDSDLAAREAALAAVYAAIAEVCARRRLEASVSEVSNDPPSVCDSRVIAAVWEACAAVGVTGHAMQSGAYHDCMSFAQEVPIGMIFIPSAGGISHSPDEYTAPEQIDLGVDVLTDTLRRLAA